MKRVLMLFGTLLFLSEPISADNNTQTESVQQIADKTKSAIYMTNVGYKRAYRANIELGVAFDRKFDITTSHGFSFGNGLYVGGGVGFGAEFRPNLEAKPTYLVPVFADIKYSFMKTLATPFVSMKGGTSVDITNSGIRTFANPAFGVDIARFSIIFGYEYQLGFWGAGNGEHFHSVKCGIGYSF